MLNYQFSMKNSKLSFIHPIPLHGVEGARSLSHFFMQICIISGYFLGLLTEMCHIQWVGV